ncbi:MAG: hypothetical protein J0M10_18260 [Chitinophagales bacterium]|nr:hypothetical protein [Chitinophagales bacterium]
MKIQISAILLLLIFFSSCSKNEDPVKKVNLVDTKNSKFDKLPITSKGEESANYYFDKYISVNPLLPNNSLKSNIISATCDAYANTVSITYLGFSDIGSPSGNGDRDITVNWLVGFPANPDNGDPGILPILNSNSRVYLEFWDLPGQPITVSAPILSLENEVFDEDYVCHLPPSRVLGYQFKTLSATFTLTQPQHCFTSYYGFSFVLSTNCNTFPQITPISPIYEIATQQAYLVVPFSVVSSSSGGIHKFTVTPLILNPACHEPALGMSPLHTFKWGPSGTTALGNPNLWNSVTKTPLQLGTPFDIIVPSAGPYDYKSKGVLFPLYNQETRYTVTQTVNVL